VAGGWLPVAGLLAGAGCLWLVLALVAGGWWLAADGWLASWRESLALVAYGWCWCWCWLAVAGLLAILSISNSYSLFSSLSLSLTSLLSFTLLFSLSSSLSRFLSFFYFHFLFKNLMCTRRSPVLD